MRTRLSTIVKWFVQGFVATTSIFFGISLIALRFRLGGDIASWAISITLVGLMCVCLLPILDMIEECVPNDLSLPRFSISRTGIHRVRESRQEAPVATIYSGGRLNVGSTSLPTGDYHVGSSTNTQFWADQGQAPIISWPAPTDPPSEPLPERRRQLRRVRSPMDVLLEALEEGQQAERAASGRRRSLQFIPDREYVALGQALHADFEGRRRSIFEISESDQAEQHRLTRIRWAEHRRNEPNCDCHRCQVYRGEVGAETEDPLGW